MSLVASYFTNKKEPSYNTEGYYLCLSKGKNLLDTSPVFDLWVFEKGQLIYNGIDNVENKGMCKTTISLDIIDQFKELVLNISPNDVGEVKGIDNPFTILKLNNKRIVYQSIRTKGKLLKLNNLLESIVENIQKQLSILA